MAPSISPQWIDDELRQASDVVTVDKLLLVLALHTYPDASIPLLSRLVAVPRSRIRIRRDTLLRFGPDELLRRGHRNRKPSDPSGSVIGPAPSPELREDHRTSLLALSRFHESLPRVDATDWTARVRESLRLLLPAAHYTSVTIRTSADLSGGNARGRIRSVTQVVGEPGMNVAPDLDYSHRWKQYLHGANREKRISFANYSFPLARDYTDATGVEFIGSALFFRKTGSRPFSSDDHAFIDFCRPFITHLFTSRILWIQRSNTLAASFSTILPTLFSGENSLTPAESPVAVQVLLGRSDREIADALHL